MKKTAHIFDSYALLKLFQKEKGYEKISRLLEDIKKAGSVKYINAINLGEIIYTAKREFGDQKKLEVLANIERLNFIILPVPNSLIFKAAEYKAQYSISYADWFILASAVELEALIVTGDPEFKRVAHLADILWV
ncbi:MAG: type II toxin-antitoxin system VapC family toxin [Thermodesulfovibrionales bacterium]|nr:type II toxin-antitoxin system VapC family toxin [Thermodesulfovibrionales bacterium]